MYTVILLDKYASELLTDYRFLFHHFEERDEIGVCLWNSRGNSFDTCIPSIKHYIQGRKEWRAVIVNADSLYDYLGCPVPSKQNPFDYSAIDHDARPHKSTIPIIRLCHILGGYPQPAKEFEDGIEFYDESICKIRRIPKRELSEENLIELSYKYGPVRPIFLEKKYPDASIRKRELIEEAYHFDGVRPSEIYLVATRNKVVSQEYAQLTKVWDNPLENSNSDFVERNKYPNHCRFLFSDISNTYTANYERELTEFWLSILTLSINRIPASTLQAYRLYRLNVKIDAEELGLMLNERLNLLTAVKNYVDELIDKEPESHYAGNEKVYDKVEIRVVQEEKDEKELFYVRKDNRDAPEWIRDLNQSLDKLGKNAKDTRRAVDRAANTLKMKTDYYGRLKEPIELDEFHLSDLQNEVKQLEKTIIASRPKNYYDQKKVLNIVDYTKEQQLEEIVEHEMEYKKTTAGVVLAIAVLGAIPWVTHAFSNNREDLANQNHDNFYIICFIVIGMLVVMLVCGLIALQIFRYKQKRKVIEVTKRFQVVENDIRDTISTYSDYFSNVGTLMSARSALQRGSLTDEVKKTYDKLSMHERALSYFIEHAEKWICNFDIERKPKPVIHVEAKFNLDIKPRENSLYYFQAAEEFADIPLNESGNEIQTPYNFISGFEIIRESVFDEAKD